MSDFRGRRGASLGAAAARLARERAAGADFRARFGLQLTSASAALASGSGDGALAGDFRGRFGAQLAACAAGLARAGAPERRAARRPRLRIARPALAAAALALFAGGATASSLWLVQVGNPNGGANPGLSATAPPPSQLAALGVLRRPQSAADRAGAAVALEDVNDFATGVRSAYVRVLETTADGPVVLVPVVRRDAGTAAAGGQAIADALCVYYPFAGAGPLASVPGCWSTAQVLAGTAVAVGGGRVFGLAPDGATMATIALGAGAGTLAAPVANNFFDAPAPSGAPSNGSGAPLPGSTPTVTFTSG